MCSPSSSSSSSPSSSMTFSKLHLRLLISNIWKEKACVVKLVMEIQRDRGSQYHQLHYLKASPLQGHPWLSGRELGAPFSPDLLSEVLPAVGLTGYWWARTSLGNLRKGLESEHGISKGTTSQPQCPGLQSKGVCLRCWSRRSQVQGHARRVNLMKRGPVFLKQKKQKEDEVREHLPGLSEALGLIASPAKQNQPNEQTNPKRQDW